MTEERGERSGMITAAEAKHAMLENPKRKQAYRYCQFLNEMSIRRAIYSGKDYTIATFGAFPNIVNEDAVAKLKEDDWLNPGKVGDCVEIDGSIVSNWFDFTNEITDWLKSLGYRIEDRKLNGESAYTACVTW